MGRGGATRVESDLLGSVTLPEEALIGIHTVRSRDNFDVSGRTLGSCRPLVRALGSVKAAAALANSEVGALSPVVAQAIVRACDRLAQGEFDDHLVCDVLEGSGGTSANMNVNEVVANVALLELGRRPGEYDVVHPNDHVNLSQSTNDVVPTAVRLAIHEAAGSATEAFSSLGDSLERKRNSFGAVLRLGRTCMQDAQPMTLGQVFGGYSAAVRRHASQMETLRRVMLIVPLGGTAVGTGLGIRLGYRHAVLRHLASVTGQPVRAAEDPFDAMQNADDCARLSAELRIAANTLWKVGNDLIILSSGPAGGLAEIRLPEVQAGSSLMPGKINPVLPMTVCQVALAVSGNELSVSLAAQQGLLDLNHYELLIADRILDSCRMLSGAVRSFATRCIDDLQADEERSWRHLRDSSAIATVLLPQLGYEKVSSLVQGARARGHTFIEHALQQGLLTDSDLRELLLRAATGADEQGQNLGDSQGGLAAADAPAAKGTQSP